MAADRQPRVPAARQRLGGVLLLVLASGTWYFLARSLGSEVMTSFGLSPGGSATPLPDWVVPSRFAVHVLSFAIAFLGGIQVARRARTWAPWIVALAAGLFVMAFLVWDAAGTSLNLAGLVKATLGKSIPLTLGGLSGILCERCGVINIGIEGMMLFGALASSMVGSLSQSLWLGTLAAVLAGGLVGLAHAVLSIRYKVNQIVSGTVVNILSAGMTSYVAHGLLQRHHELNSPGTFGPWAVPVLAEIPLLGPILFDNSVYFFAMILILALLQMALFRHRWGLRLRAVGEHPRAADTLGIDVTLTQYVGVVLGGMLAGFAGSYFTLGSVGRFDEMMTAGRGFIALGGMILGNWMPFGTLGAGLLFGFADSLSTRLAVLRLPIPSQFLLMIPYLATTVVVAGLVGRSVPPAAEGIPYERE